MKTISAERFRKGFASQPKPAKKTKNKYGATKTRGKDGRLYDSKLEAKVANELLLKKQYGLIEDYLCQVPIHFACGKRWRCDFLVITDVVALPSGIKDRFLVDQIEFIEVKGREANDREWATVKKLLKHEKPWIWERLEVRTK